MRSLLLFILGLSLWAGCSGSAPRLLKPSGDASVALRRAGLTPLVGQRFWLHGESGVLAGFVPGQHPMRRNELVVVGAAREEASGAVLLEAAQELVAQSRHTQLPDRTILVALWPSGLASAQGVAAVLDARVWPRAHVVSMILVGDAGAGAAAAADARGIPLNVVTAPGADEDAFVAAVVHAMQGAARATPDTTAAALPP